MRDAAGMSAFFYELWYKKEVGPKLGGETKGKIAKRISDLSLERPLWCPNIRVKKSKFPELAPFSKSEEFTGIQLCVVLTEIVKESCAEIPPMSELGQGHAPGPGGTSGRELAEGPDGPGTGGKREANR